MASGSVWRGGAYGEGPRWGERRRIDCGGERRRPPNAPGPVKCCFDRQELGRWLANAPDRRLRHVWKQGSAASMRYRDPQVNYYVRDVERMATFYCEHFGFVESFRYPKEGPPLKVEVRLGDFVLGFGAVEVVRSMHGLDVNPGAPRS